MTNDYHTSEFKHWLGLRLNDPIFVGTSSNESFDLEEQGLYLTSLSTDISVTQSVYRVGCVYL
jgi:hypothetical protein